MDTPVIISVIIAILYVAYVKYRSDKTIAAWQVWPTLEQYWETHP